MTDNELTLVKGALAVLSQNATFPADIALAQKYLSEAITLHEERIAWISYEREGYAQMEREVKFRQHMQEED